MLFGMYNGDRALGLFHPVRVGTICVGHVLYYADFSAKPSLLMGYMTAITI